MATPCAGAREHPVAVALATAFSGEVSLPRMRLMFQERRALVRRSLFTGWSLTARAGRREGLLATEGHRLHGYAGRELAGTGGRFLLSPTQPGKPQPKGGKVHREIPEIRGKQTREVTLIPGIERSTLRLPAAVLERIPERGRENVIFFVRMGQYITEEAAA
jgi:hypothetical protein